MRKDFPKTLRIGGFDFSVILTDPDDIDSNMGEFEKEKNRIRIADIISEDLQDSALIHEMIEALNYIYELNLDHNVITSLEGGFYQFLKDNPLWFKTRE